MERRKALQPFVFTTTGGIDKRPLFVAETVWSPESLFAEDIFSQLSDYEARPDQTSGAEREEREVSRRESEREVECRVEGRGTEGRETDQSADKVGTEGGGDIEAKNSTRVEGADNFVEVGDKETEEEEEEEREAWPEKVVEEELISPKHSTNDPWDIGSAYDLDTYVARIILTSDYARRRLSDDDVDTTTTAAAPATPPTPPPLPPHDYRPLYASAVLSPRRSLRSRLVSDDLDPPVSLTRRVAEFWTPPDRTDQMMDGANSPPPADHHPPREAADEDESDPLTDIEPHFYGMLIPDYGPSSPSSTGGATSRRRTTRRSGPRPEVAAVGAEEVLEESGDSLPRESVDERSESVERKEKYDHHKVSFYINLFENADTKTKRVPRRRLLHRSQSQTSDGGRSDGAREHVLSDDDTKSLPASEPAADITDTFVTDVVEVIAPDVEVNAADMNFCDIEDMTLEEVLEIADHKEALFLQRFSSPCLLQTPSSAKKHDNDLCEEEGGIQHLQNLIVIMKQLTDLRNENCCLRRRCDYLYNAQKFTQLRNGLGTMIASRYSRREKYFKDKQTTPHAMQVVANQTSSRSHRGEMGSRSKRSSHHRSQSMDSINNMDAASKGKQDISLGERRNRNVKKNKRFSSKWHRMKKVFSGKLEPQFDKEDLKRSIFGGGPTISELPNYTTDETSRHEPDSCRTDDIDASNPCSPTTRSSHVGSPPGIVTESTGSQDEDDDEAPPLSSNDDDEGGGKDRLKVVDNLRGHSSTNSLMTTSGDISAPLTPETGYASQAVLNEFEEDPKDNRNTDACNAINDDAIDNDGNEIANKYGNDSEDVTRENKDDRQQSPWSRVKEIIHTRRDSIKPKSLQDIDLLQDRTQLEDDRASISPLLQRTSSELSQCPKPSENKFCSPPSNSDTSIGLSDDFHVKMLEWEEKRRREAQETSSGSVFTDEFIRKMEQWQRIKGGCGETLSASAVDTASSAMSDIASDFSLAPPSSAGGEERFSKAFTRTVQEWKRLTEKRIRETGSPVPVTQHTTGQRSKSRERDRSKYEKERQKIERKEQKIEKERSKLEKMKMRINETLTEFNSSSSEGRGHESYEGHEGRGALSDEFRRKLAEWESLKSSLVLPSPSSSETRRERRQTTSVESTMNTPVSDSESPTLNKDRRRTIGDSGSDRQRSRGLSDSSLAVTSNLTFFNSEDDAIEEDIESLRSKVKCQQSTINDLRRKSSGRNSSEKEDCRKRKPNKKRDWFSAGSTALTSDDTIAELRNGLVQLRKYGDSLASRKQIVEMKVKEDAAARNKIESILLEEIECIQLSLSKEATHPTAGDGSGDLRATTFISEEHMEKLFACIHRSQYQMHQLKMGILDRNRVIDELQRHLLVQEVTNRLLEATNDRCSARIARFGRRTTAVKRWRTFAGNDFMSRNEYHDSYVSSEDDQIDEVAQKKLLKHKRKQRLVIDSYKTLQDSIRKVSYGNVDSLTVHFDLVDQIKLQLRQRVASPDARGGGGGGSTSGRGLNNKTVSVQTVMTLCNQSSEAVLACIPSTLKLTSSTPSTMASRSRPGEKYALERGDSYDSQDTQVSMITTVSLTAPATLTDSSDNEAPITMVTKDNITAAVPIAMVTETNEADPVNDETNSCTALVQRTSFIEFTDKGAVNDAGGAIKPNKNPRANRQRGSDDNRKQSYVASPLMKAALTASVPHQSILTANEVVVAPPMLAAAITVAKDHERDDRSSVVQCTQSTIVKAPNSRVSNSSESIAVDHAHSSIPTVIRSRYDPQKQQGSCGSAEQQATPPRRILARMRRSSNAAGAAAPRAISLDASTHSSRKREEGREGASYRPRSVTLPLNQSDNKLHLVSAVPPLKSANQLIQECEMKKQKRRAASMGMMLYDTSCNEEEEEEEDAGGQRDRGDEDEPEVADDVLEVDDGAAKVERATTTGEPVDSDGDNREYIAGEREEEDAREVRSSKVYYPSERGRSAVSRRKSRRDADERSCSLETISRGSKKRPLVTSASVDSQHRIARFASMQKRLTTTLPRLRRRKTTESPPTHTEATPTTAEATPTSVVPVDNAEEANMSRGQRSGFKDASHWLQKPKFFFKTAKW